MGDALRALAPSAAKREMRGIERVSGPWHCTGAALEGGVHLLQHQLGGLPLVGEDARIQMGELGLEQRLLNY
jgi:hypothetical protein